LWNNSRVAVNGTVVTKCTYRGAAFAEPPPGASNIPRDTPGVRYCNWHEFKNRLPDDDLGNAAIEVLVGGGQDFNAEVHRDRLLRNGSRRMAGPRPRAAQEEAAADGRLRSGRGVAAEGQDICRVRINSPRLLGLLADLANPSEDWATAPTTFLPPFRALVHFHDRMKQELLKLEADLDARLSQQPEGGDQMQSRDDGDPSAPEYQKRAPVRELLYAELQAYVEFVQRKILPRKETWGKEVSGQGMPRRIRFDDLCYLLRSGELIFVEPALRGQRRQGGGYCHTSRSVWKLWYTSTNYPSWESPTCGRKDDVLTAFLYSLDYDGRTCGPVLKTVHVSYFAGTMDIQKLPLYPAGLAANPGQLLQDNRRPGVKFYAANKKWHWSHIGWSLDYEVNDDGDSSGTCGLEGDHNSSPEFIDGDIVVDTATAIQAHPNWRPSFMAVSSSAPRAEVQRDGGTINAWEDRAGILEIASWTEEWIVVNDGVDIHERNVQLAADRFLHQREIRHRDLAREDLILLPSRVFAYSLGKRKFVRAHVDSLKEARATGTGMKGLRIDDGNLRKLKALMDAHFDPQSGGGGLEQKAGAEVPGPDMAKGDAGKGIIILLHGVEGVGKATTVKAVSQEYRRPILPITVQDLGQRAAEMFHLASRWDCILFLNHADVLFPRRITSASGGGKHDLALPCKLESIPACPDPGIGERHSYSWFSIFVIFRPAQQPPLPGSPRPSPPR
jgi:hypothetical protein